VTSQTSERQLAYVISQKVIEVDIIALSLKVTHPILWGCDGCIFGHVRPKGAIRALPKRVSDTIALPPSSGILSGPGRASHRTNLGLGICGNEPRGVPKRFVPTSRPIPRAYMPARILSAEHCIPSSHTDDCRLHSLEFTHRQP